VAYDRLLLTVRGPDGAVHRQEFTADQQAAFEIVRDGAALSDGTYRWEIRLVPQVDPALRQRLEASHRAGATPTAEKASITSLTLSGQFRIEHGMLVNAEQSESQSSEFRSAPSRLKPTTEKDQTVFDDLIVDGRICAGFDCFTDLVFGDAEVTLLEFGPGIEFADSSSSGSGFPFQDWGIFTGFEGFENLSVFNFTGPTLRPFTIEGSSPTNSLFVDNNGFVGMGTSVPLWDLHIRDSNTPGVWLEQDASVFAPRSWLIGANELEYFVQDVSSGAVPVRVAAGAPTNSLVVQSNGWVGLGTSLPGGNLHLFGSANLDVFAGMGPDLAAGPGFNYGYAGASFGRGAGFFNVRPDGLAAAPNPSLRFATNNAQRIIIDNEGNIGFGANVAGFNPAEPLVHQATNARLTAAGIWTNGSSRAIKQDIRPLSAADALAAFAALEPVRYRAKADPSEEHLGFIAEDVPELVAESDRTGLSPMDVVALLTRVVQEQQRAVEGQQRRIAELEARLAEQEAAAKE
jgi:hypothetical protein